MAENSMMLSADHSNSDAAQVERIPLKEFLETIHPSVQREVNSLWFKMGNNHPRLDACAIRIHCEHCDGERTFRCSDNPYLSLDRTDHFVNATYVCGDCHESSKLYSLFVVLADGGVGSAYKFGELPPFGVPVPSKVLRLFGKDSSIFLKGRQCENQGLGVGAFAYYRRVVENHKNEIFDEIIKVCEIVAAPEDLIRELKTAKDEISFTKAIDEVKIGLPQGLLINGHNPLVLLHGALSRGLHNESDEECLAAASAVRLVLTDLIEKMALLKQDNKQLQDAVKLLMSRKA
jgi:hypothetical protein